MTDLFSLEGKVALVTGGSQGIGFMIARGLLDAGAKVYIASRKVDAGDKASVELSSSGQCISLPVDLSMEDEIKRLAAEVERREPKLHVLVNNAAAVWAAPLEDYPAEAWDKVLGVNVKGVFLLCRACLPLLRAGALPGDPARIINIGSIDGFRAPEFETYAYSASKAAVHQLTRVLAQRLARDNLTVNAIAPGPFPSKMMAATLAARGDELRRRSPLGRVGEPDDMAGISVFLASRASAFVTGQIIAVDGGLSTRPW
jgi:NAD(P)-dependent dehydrogenase (short-subunit alcohol dehydrogenase family)